MHHVIMARNILKCHMNVCDVYGTNQHIVIYLQGCIVTELHSSVVTSTHCHTVPSTKYQYNTCIIAPQHVTCFIVTLMYVTHI